jgi:hypothetical protein
MKFSDQAEKFALFEKQSKVISRLIVDSCVRNSFIEDLHAGQTPCSETGDFSDVKVVSPHGEIPWSELSRISDLEMRRLLLEVEQKINAFLSLLFAGYSAAEDRDVSLDCASALYKFGLFPGDAFQSLSDPQKVESMVEHLFFTHGVSWDDPKRKDSSRESGDLEGMCHR